MAEPTNAIAFFDIGNTLASVRIGTDGQSIAELMVFPDVPATLSELRQNKVQLGIISNRGQIPEENVTRALDVAGLLQFFDALILFGSKDSPLIFEQAATRARQLIPTATGEEPLLLFVGEDANERANARAADFLVAPHPRLALTVLSRSGPLRFLRIRVPSGPAAASWQKTLRQHPLVPVHVTTAMPGDSLTQVYAIADAPTAAKLDDLGFWVDRLGAEDEPLTSDLYILRDDRQFESGFLEAAGNSFDFFRGPRSARRVLTSTSEGIFVAIPAGRSVESYHFSGARHGHNLKLMPSLTLLEPPEPENNERLAATITAAGTFMAQPAIAADALAPMLTDSQKNTLKTKITDAIVKRDVERYSGLQPVSGNTKVRSRHIHHPANAEAVRALVQDFSQIGGGSLAVRTHRFTHEGRACDNVEAISPASGLLGIVLVTAHLDSTASRQSIYRASTDPAPGADDDASGIAAVLAAARALLSMEGTIPRREMRFVLFNGEEHGLIGSSAYAREQAQIGAKIVAVFQMDMIGFDSNTERTFELHVGFTPSTDVEKRSTKLAQLIAAIIPEVSPTLPVPQLYPAGPGQGDPAESRSDHYSFQREGYASCLASEDFFAGPNPASPSADPNPNYHSPADNSVNARYAADIARAVAAAAWIAATR